MALKDWNEIHAPVDAAIRVVSTIELRSFNMGVGTQCESSTASGGRY